VLSKGFPTNQLSRDLDENWARYEQKSRRGWKLIRRRKAPREVVGMRVDGEGCGESVGVR
jgi:hypothetical protein